MELPTVASLCAVLGSQLRPAEGFSATGEPITAVHVSELVDPTAYVSGGELLLTTGLTLPGNVIGCEKYVARLKDIGIAALGIGLGPVHAELPEPLVAACRGLGLCLLVVPEPTPFLTVTKTYWAARARATEQHLQDAVAAHRALVDAAASKDPSAAVLRRLARLFDGWAANLTPEGTVEQIYPAGLAEEAEQLQAEVKRLEVAGVHSAASFAAHDRYVAVFPLSVHERVVGYLALGTPDRLSDTDRRVVLTAVALLSIDAVGRQRAASARETAGRCVATLVDLGLVDAARGLAATMDLPVPGREARVLVVRSRDSEETARVVESWCGAVLTVRLNRSDSWFLLPPDHPDTGALATRLADADPNGAALVSDLTRAEDAGIVRGRITARLRRSPDGEYFLHDDAADDRQLARRLDGFLSGQTPAMTEALVAYLRHRGQWEQAGRALGVHRNTLRYRIARVRESLGVDLDDPDHAARLWLLLRSRGLA